METARQGSGMSAARPPAHSSVTTAPSSFTTTFRTTPGVDSTSWTTVSASVATTPKPPSSKPCSTRRRPKPASGQRRSTSDAGRRHDRSRIPRRGCTWTSARRYGAGVQSRSRSHHVIREADEVTPPNRGGDECRPVGGASGSSHRGTAWGRGSRRGCHHCLVTCKPDERVRDPPDELG